MFVFGFNADEEHINGISRELIDKDNKKCVLLILIPGMRLTKEVGQKLKIRNIRNVCFVIVDKQRLYDGELWTKSLTDIMNQLLSAGEAMSDV